MTEPPEAGLARRGSRFPSPKSLGKFVLDVLQLQRTVERQRLDNEKLKAQIDQLPRQVDAHAG